MVEEKARIRTRALVRLYGWIEIIDDNTGRFDSQKEWCQTKLMSRTFRARQVLKFSQSGQSLKSYFVFKNSKDAMMFRLQWGV